MTSAERHEARYQRRKANRLKKKNELYGECNDYEKVFTYSNLFKAYKASRKNVGWKSSTQKYKANAVYNVYKTYDELSKGKFKTSGFYEFDIMERGKPRHIRSVTINERVVQRCLCDNSLVPLLSRKFIYDNGASLKNKGYDFSINRLQTHIHKHYRKHGNKGYILLYDFSKFYDNVPHNEIFRIMREAYTDDRMFNLSKHFVDAFGEKGLGLGSQVSQILALASVNKLDHFVKESLHIKGYARYNDDGYLIHESKEYLKNCLLRLREKCKELGIVLNEKKTRIVKLSHPFTFLKVRIFVTDTGRIVKRIHKSSVVRMRRKLKKFKRFVDNGVMNHEDVYASFQSWRSHANKLDAYRSKESISRLYHELFAA